MQISGFLKHQFHVSNLCFLLQSSTSVVLTLCQFRPFVGARFEPDLIYSHLQIYLPIRKSLTLFAFLQFFLHKSSSVPLHETPIPEASSSASVNFEKQLPIPRNLYSAFPVPIETIEQVVSTNNDIFNISKSKGLNRIDLCKTRFQI